MGIELRGVIDALPGLVQTMRLDGHIDFLASEGVAHTYSLGVNSDACC
jgi:hypothetical protein